MKILKVALLALTFVAAASSYGQGVTSEKWVQAIKTADSTGQLETNLAQLDGITPQQTLEAKIVWAAVKEKDAAYFSTLLPQLESTLPKWKPEGAFYLHQPSQVKATMHYMAALRANADGKDDVAKSEILEAIWLDPTASVYTKTVAEFNPPPSPRVPMDTALQTTDGRKVKLADFVKGNKALYIQIWATWCGPCLHLLPALKARYAALPPQGVAVVAMNSQLGQDGIDGGDLGKAKEVMQAKNMGLPCLIEPADGTYTHLLGIDSVPRALVVDADGNVLYNDHPMDEKLVRVLKRMDVTIDLNDGLAADGE
jgi:thiol-disulfide isomerase/thioredoxin